MRAKDILIDFINFIFAIVIIGLAILYFIAGDNFENFRRVLESLAPLAILGIIFLINLKFWREKEKKKEREGDLDLNLRLTFIDKLKSDAFLFLIPAAVLLLAFLANKSVGLADILAAAVVFIIAYLWQRWLFGKERM
ncbi:MAG TPA: hypothetical protein VMC41_02995 [Candidatus Nanoarchaeia archaeon]|nr:hypothetical protein [Candidatus Nanoarchaeia archaeon]